jgi:hypothetical protein
VLAAAILVAATGWGPAAAAPPATIGLAGVVAELAALGDRSTGTPGNAKAADLIRARLTALGVGEVASHRFAVPVIRRGRSTLSLPALGRSLSLNAFEGNAVTPQAVLAPGISGPLVYAADGQLGRLNGKPIQGAILVMELESGKNWVQAANLGAAALIYVDRGGTARGFFEEKYELSPVQFPRFWMPVEELRSLFGDFEAAPGGLVAGQARLVAEARWENAVSENIICLIPGTAPGLKEELLVVEAFYDSTARVAGRSPGADEALGAATLLELAAVFKEHPPGRSVLLAATSGHAQSLAGLREMVGSLTARSRDMRDARRDLRATIRKARLTLAALKGATFEEPASGAGGGAPGVEAKVEVEEGEEGEEGGGETPAALLKAALEERLKTDADLVSRRLMHLRLSEADRDPKRIQKLSAERQLLRRLMWRPTYTGLSDVERAALEQVAARAGKDQQALLADARAQLKLVESANQLRGLAQGFEVAAAVSLHLSSHGDGVGAFNHGFLYPFRPRINRLPAYAMLQEVLQAGAADVEREIGRPGMFKDALRPSRLRSWQSHFLDRPALGGEVTALAGFHGITLATTGDGRAAWGTPHDLPAGVDAGFARGQSQLVCGLLRHLSRAPKLNDGEFPRNGFGTIAGRAKFLRHGELFADKPAPGTVLFCYQGPARFYAMVDQQGRFTLKGAADKTHSFHKVILEGYRFDDASGEAVWVIDKKLTGKDAYRVKMNRRFMETDLVMFAGSGVTLFNMLEPRTFRHLTKPDVIDGRREADPQRWFMSRLDTWSSSITSVFLEPGTSLKLTLSDSVLRRKLVLLNATADNPTGTGYPVSDFAALSPTEYRVARDMWTLITPRVANLEARGIFNERVRALQTEGLSELKAAEAALAEKAYDRFIEASARSWALALRVYEDVDQTQKDVLYGVLFYIALFVPFAFCLERLLFAYANIYRRIAAFLGILTLLIAVIYSVHPAFRLAYSPMVVILAFFIMGLSLIVTLIIFFRFEQEMAQLQTRARQVQDGEIGRWKAFVAAFLLGVSNLRRRRLRTALTCATLVILTFTIMSFTSVKSMRRHARILYDTGAAYQGFLIKNANWADLPVEALGAIGNAFAGLGVAVPRVWLEEQDRTRTTYIPLRAEGRSAEAQGLVGLSAEEGRVSGLDAILVGGRWFEAGERNTALLPERLALNLGIDPQRPEGHSVLLWGTPFAVVGVFSGKKLQERTDLDGEPLTPATFPREMSADISEEEVEALESGEDVRVFQSRYEHTAGELTVIVPHQTLLAAGGRLKAVAVHIHARDAVQAAAEALVDRFGLSVFSGEPQGTFLYHASDTMSYSGVPNIIIPLAISVFIVLNTMIGSVYERKREIAVYTSVGLAPSHVAFLFIAEALAFAVLSVVTGYLLAQTSAKLFAETGLWSGITVNYSSLSGVAAMLLVIVVVLVSVLYPARVAAAIAIPDVNRSWTLPAPRGNRLDMVFPFLMTYREHASVGGFLYDYFEGHQDVSHGIFSTAGVAMRFVCETAPAAADPDDRCPGEACAYSECLNFSTQVWLAPFDFGIMQEVALQFRPSSDEPGFLEIHVGLTRESGEANAWLRINKGFLHVIRRQLLIWRSLDAEGKRHYEEVLTAARARQAAAGEGRPTEE